MHKRNGMTVLIAIRFKAPSPTRFSLRGETFSEIEVLFPIHGSIGSQYLLHRLQRFSLPYTREERTAPCDTDRSSWGEAYMWKVIGTKTQKSPLLNGHGSWQPELALQVAEFFLKFQNNNHPPPLGPPPARPCLPQEESPPLETDCPDACLRRRNGRRFAHASESNPHQPEAEVTSKSNEEKHLPNDDCSVRAAGI